MKSVLKLSLLLSCVSFLVDPLQANIFEDKDFMRKLRGQGVRAAIIGRAKENPTKQTVTDLILAAAPICSLERILELYPTDITQKDMGASAAYSPQKTKGEDEFFKDCSRSPDLFTQFFYAMAEPYFHGKNPFITAGPNSEDLRITDITCSYFNGLFLEKNKISTVNHHQITTYFSSFSQDIQKAINLPYLKKLLKIQYDFPNRQLQKKAPDKSHKIRTIRQLAPYIRGEIALEIERDLPLALEYFLRSKKATPQESALTALLDVRLAELYLGVFKNVSKIFDPFLLNETRGRELLEAKVKSLRMKNPPAQLRLAQYYLGFFGHAPQEDRGLQILRETAEMDEVSHLAYRTWADYYLGIANPNIFDMDQAQRFLSKSIEECRGIEPPCYAIYLRQGEIALGTFQSQDDEDSDDSPTKKQRGSSLQNINVPLAIELFQKVTPDANLFLYRIFTGYYGEEYMNEKAAGTLWDKMLADGSDFCMVKNAIRLYEQGDIDQAVKIFDQYKNALQPAYYLARIRSNPKHAQYYDIDEAIRCFTAPFDWDFRDSRQRALNLVMEKIKSMNCSPAPRQLAKAVLWVLEKAAAGEKITREKMRKSRFFIKVDKTGSEGETSSHDTSSSDLTLPEDATADASSHSAVGEHEEEVSEAEVARLLEGTSPLDTTALIRSLRNQKIQDLYDGLGRVSKWLDVKRVVKAFGGEIDSRKRSITFPNSDEVFNYHNPHNHNGRIVFHKQWAILKRMIDHEYEILCQQETDNNDDDNNAVSDFR